MARGQPDFSPTQPFNSIGGHTDPVEAIARLGGYAMFDRSGFVTYVDGFENGLLSWETSKDDLDTITIDNTNPFLGAQCVKLSLGKNGSVVGYIRKILPLVTSRRLGFEMMFAPSNQHEFIEINTVILENGNGYRPVLRFEKTPATLFYNDVNGSFVELADFDPLTVGNTVYHFLKLVVDIKTGEYVRVRFDNENIDMSGIAMENSGGGAARGWIDVRLQIFPPDSATTAVDSFIDNFGFTVDER